MAVPAFPSYSTPQQYAAYFNAHLNGGKTLPIPDPLTGQTVAGATIGDQWLAWYASDSELRPGNSLQQYAEGFVVVWTDAEFGSDLSGALTAGAQDVGTEAENSVPQLPGLPQIGSFFSALTQGATWIRVAEVLIGGILLLIGLNKAFGNPAGKAASAARGVALA
jgi:hypothetical protein